MGNITLLELNVPEGDIQLGPKSLRGSKSETDSPQTEPAETAETADTTDDSSGRSLAALLVVVGFIAVVAVMASKLLGEDADDEIAGFDDAN